MTTVKDAADTARLVLELIYAIILPVFVGGRVYQKWKQQEKQQQDISHKLEQLEGRLFLLTTKVACLETGGARGPQRWSLNDPLSPSAADMEFLNPSRTHH
jgi:hypothetical protein